jgi:hypothetical protein
MQNYETLLDKNIFDIIIIYEEINNNYKKRSLFSGEEGRQG